jgi:hypothetical protein
VQRRQRGNVAQRSGGGGSTAHARVIDTAAAAGKRAIGMRCPCRRDGRGRQSRTSAMALERVDSLL